MHIFKKNHIKNIFRKKRIPGIYQGYSCIYLHAYTYGKKDTIYIYKKYTYIYINYTYI